MRTPFVVVCLLAAALSGGAAQTPQPTVLEPSAKVTGLTVTHVGIYTAETTSVPAQAGQQTPTKTVATAAGWHFASASNEVKAKIGAQFGIEFRIDGAPDGSAVTLYLVLIFPPEGIRNPNTGDLMHEARVAFPNMKIGSLCLLGYNFGNAWEIAPGVWTEQIWYQDRMLAEQKFTVSKAE